MSTRFRNALAVVLSLTLAASPLLAESARVAAASVNVRKGPSTGTPVVATLSRGDTLEVLARDGDWARVRTRAGVEGYVSARFLQPVPATAAPTTTPPAAAPVAPAAAVPAAPTASAARVSISHKEVGCVVAGAFPRLDACFTPAEAVGRAQVLFRADENSPWYYVEMKPEGACQSAVLPKPTRSLSSFRYFIEAVDRSFNTVGKPEAAPGESYAPRVVVREVECQAGVLVAKSQPSASVLLGVARDSGGKVLQAAAARTAELGGSVTGFSTDGVTMIGGAAPSAGSAGSKAAKAGGLGGKTLLIVGGVAAAGAVAAVAGGGGGGGGSNSGGSGGPSGSGPSGGTSPGSSSLTGHWVGNAGSGDGLSLVISGPGITCNYSWDLTTDVVHTGSTFTGTGSTVTRTFNCSIPLPPAVTAAIGAGGSGSFSGTASGGSIATDIGGIYHYTGTYTSTRIEMVSNEIFEGLTLRSTWRQTKQ
jgi:hypothetical protein